MAGNPPPTFCLSGDEGDEHKWVIPSAVSADSHKELTVRQIIQHFGFFASDAILEDKISAFFAQRATLALTHVGHLLSDQEFQNSVSAFLDLRPDDDAFHQKRKRVVILEFTRAMDSSEDWETEKDAETWVRYAPVLEFFNSLPENHGWTLLQLKFTVGVRGSISNVDRTEPLSFLSTLKTRGITSRVNLEKIRKATAKRAFEAHDLLLRSYYAVKSCPSPS
jgi:hypothetical protein